MRRVFVCLLLALLGSGAHALPSQSVMIPRAGLSNSVSVATVAPPPAFRRRDGQGRVYGALIGAVVGVFAAFALDHPHGFSLSGLGGAIYLSAAAVGALIGLILAG